MGAPGEIAWYRLDNAAKIFPPTSKKSDTRVFRFSCELCEAVDGGLLQAALERTIDDFPGFCCVLKRGMFWYYLEQSDIHPLVREEDSPPCSTVYLERKTLLFDVTWYGKRINLEVYHVLTDGTGALQFLKTLVLHYLKAAHPEAIDAEIHTDFDGSETQKMADSFDRHYESKKSKMKLKAPAAYQIKGAKEAEWRLNIIEGSVSTAALLKKAREYDAKITVLITAILARAIYAEMNVRDKEKPVVINVPVNLRNYFDSKSTRNFFSVVYIQYDFKGENDTLEDVVNGMKENFDGLLSKEHMKERLNKLIGFERNLLIRPVPLAIKNLYMNIAYSFAAREVTATLSNMGKVDMPEETKPCIKLFDVFCSTNKLQVCICSYGDVMNISFTSVFVSTDIQRNFFRQLTELGIDVEISANNLRGNGGGEQSEKL